MGNSERSQSIDIAKGILIILVVAGHAQADGVHDIIFLFHMPLFFIISGFLMKREKLTEIDYLIRKIKQLMIPYAVYLALDMLIVRRTVSVRDWIYAIWGGRAVTGVYWYMTCYLFALFLLSILVKRFSDKIVKYFILVGGGV